MPSSTLKKLSVVTQNNNLLQRLFSIVKKRYNYLYFQLEIEFHTNKYTGYNEVVPSWFRLLKLILRTRGLKLLLKIYYKDVFCAIQSFYYVEKHHYLFVLYSYKVFNYPYNLLVLNIFEKVLT